MPVDPDQIRDITAGAVDLYRAAEQAILQLVTRRLAAGMDSPDWATTRLGALATLRGSVSRVLTLLDSRAGEQLRETVAQAYRLGTAAATTELPARLLPRDPDAVRARAAAYGRVRTDVVESLGGALVQDVGAKSSNVLRHVDDVYRRVIAEANAAGVAGGLTRRQASQIAYQRFVDQGITSFVDARGRTWRLSSYVEMAVRTVSQRAAVQGETDRLQAMGHDLVIISDSPHECPKCRPWEGKILSISGRQVGRVEVESAVAAGTVAVDVAGTLDHARSAGLFHPNCTHSVRIYLPGATKPKRPDADPAGYKAQQRQRHIERQIRKYKEREQAALDPAAAKAARAKTRAWQAEMRNHLAANPKLKRLPYREQPGAGNIPPGSAVLPSADRPLNLPHGTMVTPNRPPLPQRAAAPSTAPKGLGDVLDLQYPRDEDDAIEVFADVVNGTYAGITATVDAAAPYPMGVDNNGVLFRIELRADGLPVGSSQRGFYRDLDGSLVAVHAYLALSTGARGQGFASAFNATLEAWYRQQGVTRIEIHADIDVGGYTWASHGYDWADQEGADSVVERLEHTINAYIANVEKLRDAALTATGQRAAELAAQIRKLQDQIEQARSILDRAASGYISDDGYPTPYEISQCGRTPGAQTWLGRDVMLGSDWQGVKWL